MKKLLTFLTLSLFLFTSCSGDGEIGPRGPQGPPGEPGEPGQDGLIGTVFEAEIDFEGDTYYEIVGIPEDIEVLSSDVVLVYLLEYVDEETGNDVWSLLPQTFYLDEGQLVYNYNHTLADVEIFLDGTIDLSTLGEEYTDNQVFRIVIIPADPYETLGVNASDYSEVEAMLKIKERKIPRVKTE